MNLITGGSSDLVGISQEIQSSQEAPCVQVCMSSSGEFMSLEPQEEVGEDTGREQDQELDLWDIGFTSSALAKLVLGPRKKNPFLIPGRRLTT